MKPIRSVAALAIAGLIGALGVAAGPAAAAANAPVHASASSVVRSPHADVPAADITCSYHSDKFVTYTNGCVNWINWTCSQGNEHPLSPAPDYVANACALNVDLYTNSNYTGTVLCIRLDSRTSLTAGRWHSFRMITGSC